MRGSKILNSKWRWELEMLVVQLEWLPKVMIQYSRLRVLYYWLYSYKQNNQICNALHAYLWSCIQGQIAKTERVKLNLGTAQCSSLLWRVLSLHQDCWNSVGAQLKEVVAILSLAFLPIEAAAGFIVGDLSPIAVRLSRMQDRKSRMLHWPWVHTQFGTW